MKCVGTSCCIPSIMSITSLLQLCWIIMFNTTPSRLEVRNKSRLHKINLLITFTISSVSWLLFVSFYSWVMELMDDIHDVWRILYSIFYGCFTLLSRHSSLLIQLKLSILYAKQLVCRHRPKGGVICCIIGRTMSEVGLAAYTRWDFPWHVCPPEMLSTLAPV